MAIYNSWFDIAEQPIPPNPDPNYLRLYGKTNKKLYFRDSNGIETEIGSTSGGTTTISKTIYPALDAADISNKFYDLPNIPEIPVSSKVRLEIVGGAIQVYGIDFAVINDGITGVRRLIWDSTDPNVDTGMVSFLNIGDKLRITYTYI